MSVPTKKTPKKYTRTRRSHHALTAQISHSCPQCSTPLLSHSACSSCGYYKGRQVKNIITKAEKQQRKNLKNQAKAQKQSQKEDSVTKTTKEVKK